MAQQTQQTPQTVDANLIHDIRDFTHIFHRNPTPDEVLDWAHDIYHRPMRGTHTFTYRWACDLTQLATHPDEATAADVPPIVFPKRTSQQHNADQ